MTNKKPALPVDAKARKALPIATGVLDYFPDALAAVAELSRIGNDQHNPGQPLHWSKHKSSDHADCLVRHLIDRGTTDSDGVRHSAKVAWRALALLQIEIEASNAGLKMLHAVAVEQAKPVVDPSEERNRMMSPREYAGFLKKTR